MRHASHCIELENLKTDKTYITTLAAARANKLGGDRIERSARRAATRNQLYAHSEWKARIFAISHLDLNIRTHIFFPSKCVCLEAFFSPISISFSSKSCCRRRANNVRDVVSLLSNVRSQKKSELEKTSHGFAN